MAGIFRNLMPVKANLTLISTRRLPAFPNSDD